MIDKDILSEVKRIEITSSHLVSDVFAGAYHSVFKGQGMEFDEVREYAIGDDVRSIDWNVTARMGRPFIKKFVEEREQTVLVVVDSSASAHFGSRLRLKSQLAAHMAAVLSLSATRNHDKAGLLMFTDQIERFIPPRKGKNHVARIIRDVLYLKPQGKGTNIPFALEHLTKAQRRRAIVFVISDFFGHNSAELIKSLRLARRRHDVIAVTLNDPREFDLPDCGLVELMDAETGQRQIIDTSNERLRKEYVTRAQDRVNQRRRLFSSAGVDHIDISTDKPFTADLIAFFRQRQKRLNRGL